MKYKALNMLVIIGGVIIGVTLAILITFPLLNKALENNKSRIQQPQETVDDKVKSNLKELIQEPLIKSQISIDTTNFDKNEAGQTIYNGQILIDGILASDIPTGQWQDDNFITNQIQRVARKIYLMKPYEQLANIQGNMPIEHQDLQLTMQQKLNIWINNQQYLSGNYNNQLYEDEVATALRVFLCVYMNLWDLSSVTIIPTEHSDGFQDFDIDYTFGVQVSENYMYLVGVKTETQGDEITLNMLYITNQQNKNI